MALKDKKVSDSLLQTGVVSAPDKLTGTAAENKMVFDRLIRNIVAQSVNPLIDELTGENGAASIGFPGGNLGAFSAQALAHIADKKNPHGVTVAQIGAETPEGAQQKINAAMAAHKADQNNPHGVTTTQIGAETPEGAQQKVDAAMFAHQSNQNNPHHVTVSQIGAETPEGAQQRADKAAAEAKAYAEALAFESGGSGSGLEPKAEALAAAIIRGVVTTPIITRDNQVITDGNRQEIHAFRNLCLCGGCEHDQN